MGAFLGLTDTTRGGLEILEEEAEPIDRLLITPKPAPALKSASTLRPRGSRDVWWLADPIGFEK